MNHSNRFFVAALFLVLQPIHACAQELPEQPVDFLRTMQFQAVEKDDASWGHWGDHPGKYSSWTNHSNRLVPIYTFGIRLDKFMGKNSIYRDAARLQQLYGQLPTETLNPAANYMDQTEVYQLQKQAIAAGKKNIILMIFDGMDWQTTQAAAIYKNRNVLYTAGRGSGLAFLDYKKNCDTDFGYFVCSPHNEGTKFDVDSQIVKNPGGNKRGGYAAEYGGSEPWSKPKSDSYLLGKQKNVDHVFTDSAASATSMVTGYKTYNSAINVGPEGQQLVPIARELQDKGFKVGVVANVPISHATPAAMYANNVNRDDYQDLSRDMLGLRSISHKDTPLQGMDVVIGCGWGEFKDDDRTKQGQNFIPGNKNLAESDMEEIDVKNGGKYVVAQRTKDQNGKQLLQNAATQAANGNHRLLGFFGTQGGHLPYQSADGHYDPTRGKTQADRYEPSDISENPTLEDMTRAALDVLSSGDKGFWLMIEAGDVDWANHNNNIDDSIGAVLSGETAFEAVTEWVEHHSNWDETALIVTADHGHYLVVTDLNALTGKPAEPKEVETAAASTDKAPEKK